MSEMTDFDHRLSQRWKVVLRRLEQYKIYPNLLAWYLQCYLDPEVAIYLERCLLMDELIPLIKKKGGKCKGQRRKVINLWLRSYIWYQLLN